MVVPIARLHVGPCSSRQIAIATTLHMSRHAAFLSGSRDDVDGTHKRRCAIDTSGRSFEHFDTLNLTDIDGKIKGIVTALRVADINAVEQDCDLFVVASTDADVGLRSNWSTLADIHSCGVFQQIINTLHRRSLNVATLQYSYHSRCLVAGHRSSRPHDAHLVESHLAVGLGGNGVGGDRAYAHALGTCVRQGGYAQCADDHLASKTGKKRVTLASKSLEHNYSRLLS